MGWMRRALLWLALGRRTYGYMRRSVLNDPRTPRARMVDIVVRQDGREVRTEADWVKKLARIFLGLHIYCRPPWHRHFRRPSLVLQEGEASERSH